MKVFLSFLACCGLFSDYVVSKPHEFEIPKHESSDKTKLDIIEASIPEIDSFLVTDKSNDRKTGTYRGAVYEHAVVLPLIAAKARQEALQQMMKNLDEYKTQAAIAANSGVDILVFPEDGIYGMLFKNHAALSVYLETIPDPKQEHWTPCDDPLRYSNTDVQVVLSCIAKHNRLYLVANYGDAQPCDPDDPNCPDDGQYQYNTDLVYDNTGAFVAKYHKENLFFEPQFDQPKHPEYVYFDTPFGRFGVFTCFDILFHNPAIPLVEQYNITDVVFPTAWMDVMPYFSAVGFHSSFAAAHGVNLLAANIHFPLFQFQGSGIYTPTGANTFYYDHDALSSGKLLISDIDIIDRNKILNNEQELYLTVKKPLKRNVNYEPQNTIFHDTYNFVFLVGKIADKVTVCQNGLCCNLHYNKQDTGEHFALGVLNGLHTYHGQYYLQVCIIVICSTAEHSSCDGTETVSNTRFNSFTMTGNFTTKYQYPQIILSSNNSLLLPSKGSYNFGTNSLQGTTLDKPLLTAAIVGRLYDRD